MSRQAPHTRDAVKKASKSFVKSHRYLIVVGMFVLTVMMFLLAFQYMAPSEDPIWPSPSQPPTAHILHVQML